MEQAEINFKQERDFGEIFSATFAFIGQEIKRLGTAMLYFVLPVLLLAAIIMVLFGAEQQKITQEVTGGDPYAISNPFSMMGGMFTYMLLLMFVYALAFTMLKCTIYGYIKLYNEKGRDGFGLSEIWSEIMRYFFPVLGTSIVVGLLVGFGFVFCILPGIYLGVSLSIIYVALLFEGKGFGNAFSRSFDLTKQKWWLTLGLIIVSYLMIYMIAMIFSIPAMIAGVAPMIHNLKNLEQPEPIVFSTAYYVLNSITYLITYILLAIPAIILAFHYFSLVELKDKPSLIEKIDQIESNE
jgi:hypothetical protein